MAAPKISKSDQEVIDAYGFEFSEPPVRERTRRSKYDDMWASAIALCQRFPHQSLKVRSYGNSSGAYSDAKKINDGAHRMFEEYEVGHFSATPAESEDPSEIDEDGNKFWWIYLRFDPEGITLTEDEEE